MAGHHVHAKGAVNKKHGLNEYDETKKIISFLAALLRAKGNDVQIFYGHLTHKIHCINAGKFDIAIDLHLNAGGGHGCEVVHVPHSESRHEQAALMSATISKFMGIRDRGAKEGWYKMDVPGQVDYPGDIDGDEHGDAFVEQTNCPAFIPEPLFIDNDAEVEKWLVAGMHDQIAEALMMAIEEVLA